MARSLSDAANYIMGQFNRFGIKVSEDSRIKSMYDSVCKEDGSSRGLISEKDQNFDIAREALRDLSQLEFFFDQIRSGVCYELSFDHLVIFRESLIYHLDELLSLIGYWTLEVNNYSFFEKLRYLYQH